MSRRLTIRDSIVVSSQSQFQGARSSLEPALRAEFCVSHGAIQHGRLGKDKSVQSEGFGVIHMVDIE